MRSLGMLDRRQADQQLRLVRQRDLLAGHLLLHEQLGRHLCRRGRLHLRRELFCRWRWGERGWRRRQLRNLRSLRVHDRQQAEQQLRRVRDGDLLARQLLLHEQVGLCLRWRGGLRLRRNLSRRWRRWRRRKQRRRRRRRKQRRRRLSARSDRGQRDVRPDRVLVRSGEPTRGGRLALHTSHPVRDHPPTSERRAAEPELTRRAPPRTARAGLSGPSSSMTTRPPPT